MWSLYTGLTPANEELAKLQQDEDSEDPIDPGDPDVETGRHDSSDEFYEAVDNGEVQPEVKKDPKDIQDLGLD